MTTPRPRDKRREWLLIATFLFSMGLGVAGGRLLETEAARRGWKPWRLLAAAGVWGILWAALTRGTWMSTFYDAAWALLQLDPWPRGGAWGLIAGWPFWSLVVGGLLPYYRAHYGFDGPLPTAPPPPDPNALRYARDERGRWAYLTDAMAKTAILIFGAPGMGKTELLLQIVAWRLRRGLPVIIIDAKGAPDFRKRVVALSAKYGRHLRVWSFDGPCTYNPLLHGTLAELRDKLIAIEIWTEPHYKRAAERYLVLLFGALQATGRPVDLHAILDGLDPQKLLVIARDIPDEERRKHLFDYVQGLDAGAKSAVAGLANRLAGLVETEAGQWLRAAPDGTTDIDLLATATEGGAVLFSLNSLRLPDLTAQMGALILQDLTTVTGALLARGNTTQLTVAVDEFNAFRGPQALPLFNKGREAGVSMVLVTQDPIDIVAVGGQTLRGQLSANAGIKISLRLDLPESAQFVAAGAGTRKSLALSHQTRGGTTTGEGSAREVEEPILDPNVLMSLQPYEAVVLSKTPKPCVKRVHLEPVED